MIYLAVQVSTALAGFLFTMSTIVLYFRSITRMKVAVEVERLYLKLFLGILISSVAIYLDWTQMSDEKQQQQRGGWWAVMIIIITYLLVGLAIFFASFLVLLLAHRKMPLGDIKVSIGDASIPFRAKTITGGKPFNFNSTTAFQGQRVLLKFFRGGW